MSGHRATLGGTAHRMQHISSTVACALLVALCANVEGAQANSPTAAGTQANPTILADGGPANVTPSPAGASVFPRLSVTADLLAGLPRRSVTVTEENGESATYSGVDLGLLLAKSGAPHGTALRGSAAAAYVLIRAVDGYRAVFALTELDASVTDKIVVLADQRNGAPIGPELGPFRIIVPDEKHHLRWVRNVVDIAVLSAP